MAQNIHQCLVTTLTETAHKTNGPTWHFPVESNLSLALARKYVRIVTAYYLALRSGKSIVQADAWIRKHRSHRSSSDKMDAELELL